jgi:hypothetical protein
MIAMQLAGVCLGLVALACNGAQTRRAEGGCRYVPNEGTCRLREVEPIDDNSDDPDIRRFHARYAWVGAPPAGLTITLPPGHELDTYVEWTVRSASLEPAIAHVRSYDEVACVLSVDTSGICGPAFFTLGPDVLPMPPGAREASYPGHPRFSGGTLP